MAEMKKIFFLINSLELGGAERQLVNLCKGLCNNYDITILTLIKGKFYDFPSSVKIISLTDSDKKSSLLLKIPAIKKEFQRILSKGKPYLVVSSLEPANFINLAFNKGRKVISVEVDINYFYSFKLKNIPYRFLIDLLYKKADRIKVNSDENKYIISTLLKIPASKIKVIYNPAELEKAEASKKENIDPVLAKKIKGRTVFVSVGRLIPHKNFDLVIKAFKRIHDKNPEAILLIRGYGPEEKKIRRLISEFNLENDVVIIGFEEQQKDKNIFKFLKCGHYFIYASAIEGFPNVLVEATAMNLPIITSNFKTGALEVIDPDNKNYGQKLSYPYYGTNGVMLDINHFEEQAENLDYKKIKQKQKGIERFKIKNVIKEYRKEILK